MKECYCILFNFSDRKNRSCTNGPSCNVKEMLKFGKNSFSVTWRSYAPSHFLDKLNPEKAIRDRWDMKQALVVNFMSEMPSVIQWWRTFTKIHRGWERAVWAVRVVLILKLLAIFMFQCYISNCDSDFITKRWYVHACLFFIVAC